MSNLNGPRMNRRDLLKYMGLGGVAVAGTSLLAACASGESGSGATGPSAPPQKGGTMRVGIISGGATSVFTPYSPNTSDAEWIGVSLFEPIRSPDDQTFQMTDLLCESIEPANNGQQWIVKLKKGIEFHNGKTVDADDMIYTYGVIKDPATGAMSSSGFQILESMKKLDDHTVRFDLTGPSGYFPIALSQRGTTGLAPAGWKKGDAPIGTGPFKFRSRSGDTTTLVRFDNYWGDVAYLDEVQLTPIVDPNARVNALSSGAIDLCMNLPVTSFNRFHQDPRFGVIDAPSGLSQFILMRTDSGEFADNNVRTAIKMAVDRDQILEVVYGGHGVIANDVYGKYDPAFDESLVRTRDLAGAKALIKKAGAEGDEVTFVTIAGEFQSICEIVAQAANDIGLKANVQVKDTGSYYANFPGWYAATDSCPALPFLSIAGIYDAPGATYNGTFFSNAQYDAYWNEAVGMLTQEEQKAPIQGMQKILFDQGGYIIPVFKNTVAAHAGNTSGWPTADHLGLGIQIGLNKVGFTA
ncbi:ABC transporter substrate-binding protein [Gordonia sp. NPDC003376]